MYSGPTYCSFVCSCVIYPYHNMDDCVWPFPCSLVHPFSCFSQVPRSISHYSCFIQLPDLSYNKYAEVIYRLERPIFIRMHHHGNFRYSKPSCLSSYWDLWEVSEKRWENIHADFRTAEVYISRSSFVATTRWQFLHSIVIDCIIVFMSRGGSISYQSYLIQLVYICQHTDHVSIHQLSFFG